MSIDGLRTHLQQVNQDQTITAAEATSIQEQVHECRSEGVSEADIDQAFQTAGLERPTGQTAVDSLATDHPIRARASEQYSQGQQQYDRRDYEEARASFRDANQTLPHPGSVKSEAACAERTGDLAGARELYAQYLEQNPAAENRAELQQRMDAMQDAQVLSRSAGSDANATERENFWASQALTVLGRDDDVSPAELRSEVRGLQQQLADWGADNGEQCAVDGLAGPETQAAVRSFQQAQGLPMTGVFDEATRAALG